MSIEAIKKFREQKITEWTEKHEEDIQSAMKGVFGFFKKTREEAINTVKFDIACHSWHNAKNAYDTRFTALCRIKCLLEDCPDGDIYITEDEWTILKTHKYIISDED
jgi:hypothetical protein